MFHKLSLIAATTLLVTTLWAQEKVTYVMLGTYQGVSYESELKPAKETGKTRNVFLTGDEKDLSLIQDWQFDCANRSIKLVHRGLYAPDNTLIKEEDVKSDWQQTEKGSFGNTMLKYWCEDKF
jgi:hypothetical protein